MKKNTSQKRGSSSRTTRVPVPSKPKTGNTKKSTIDMEKPAESAGEVLGKNLGRFAGRILGRIIGSGDYEAELPVGGSVVEATMVPQFTKADSSRGTRVQHREYLGDVTASSIAGAFKNQSFSLNPGLYSSFPWLSGIASRYDQWKPHGMAIIFKSLSSNYSSTTSLGTVVLTTDYDVFDSPYMTKVEAENAEFAVSGNSSQSLVHPIECNIKERLTELLTVRSSAVPAGDNARFFDLGNLQVISQGCQADQLLGELWVTYDIEFFKPQIANQRDDFLFHVQANTSSCTSTDLFGGIVTYSPGTNCDISIAGNRITFPRNTIGCSFNIQQFCSFSAGTASSSNTPQWTFSGCAYGPQLYTLSNGNIINATGVQMRSVTVTIIGTTDGSPIYMDISSSAYPPPTGSSLYSNSISINQISSVL